MAVRIPLVVGGDGLPQQLQPGDTLSVGGGGGVTPPGPAGFVFVAENTDLPTMPAGAAVTIDALGIGVVLAVANAPNRTAIALSQSQVLTAEEGEMQTAGLLQLSDWTHVAGTQHLIPKARYFLDPVRPGLLTTVPPTLAGQVLQLVGQALLSDTMNLLFNTPIIL